MVCLLRRRSQKSCVRVVRLTHTFYLKNPTLFSQKVGNLSDFSNIFQGCLSVCVKKDAIFQGFLALKSATRCSCFLPWLCITIIVLRIMSLMILATWRSLCSELIFSTIFIAERPTNSHFGAGNDANITYMWARPHEIFEKLDFSRNLTHFRFSKNPSPICRILASILQFPKKSFPIFRSQEKCFPDFSGFRKSFPDFPFFGKSFPNFWFWKLENRAKISDFA